MKITIDDSDSICVVRVGPIARRDPASELHIIKETSPGHWEKIFRELVNGRKKFEFPDFTAGHYHVMVVGNKIAGVATTGGRDMPFPFNVYLEPNQEHAKDFIRLSLPANKPVVPTLAELIKHELKEKK